MNAYERVTDALSQHGCAQKGRDWNCPAHNDSSQSLSVNEGDSNNVVMRCHAGCGIEEVLETLRLKPKDLFNETLEKKKPDLELVDTYPYVDEAGELLFEVLRYSPKTFRQRKPKPGGGWEWRLGDARRVLFRLPQLIAAVAGGERIFFVEGEKDVLAVEVAGGVGVTIPAGAGSKWRSEYTEFFRGANVTIVADKDEPGRKFAHQVQQAISGVASAVFMVEAKEGKDAFDHLAAGYLLDEFIEITAISADSDSLAVDGEEGKEVLESVASEEGRVNPLRAKLLTTNEVDSIPPPRYIVKDFLVADTLSVLYGQPGHGKSFLAADWALSIGNGLGWQGKEVAQGEAIYIVAEGLSGIGPRKRAWQREHGIENPTGVTWVRDAVNVLDTQAMDDLLEISDEIQPLLIVVDTLARSMPGANENDGSVMSTAVENLDRLRKATGACVLIVHHAPKEGGSPRGHGTLLGAVQTSIAMEKLDGEVQIRVEKQKDGEEVEMNLRLMGVHLAGEENGSAVLRSVADMGLPNATMNEVVLLRTIREASGPEGLSTTLAMRLSGLPERTFYRAKSGLMDRKELINVGTERQPRYAIPAGQEG